MAEICDDCPNDDSCCLRADPVAARIAELSATADLLARVRQECRIDVTETGVEGIGVLIGITITGMDRDGMRELAEALKRSTP